MCVIEKSHRQRESQDEGWLELYYGDLGSKLFETVFRDKNTDKDRFVITVHGC